MGEVGKVVNGNRVGKEVGLGDFMWGFVEGLVGSRVLLGFWREKVG